MEKLSNINTVKEILHKHGFTFSKALGQNFLINPSVCPRMAMECGVDENSGVIEVVYMGDPFDVTMGQVNMVVAGYIITFRDGKTLYVHKDSHFYTVQEAYEAGYITKEDIEDFGPKVCVKFKEWEGEVVTSDGSLIVTIPPA